MRVTSGSHTKTLNDQSMQYKFLAKSAPAMLCVYPHPSALHCTCAVLFVKRHGRMNHDDIFLLYLSIPDTVLGNNFEFTMSCKYSRTTNCMQYLSKMFVAKVYFMEITRLCIYIFSWSKKPSTYFCTAMPRPESQDLKPDLLNGLQPS